MPSIVDCERQRGGAPPSAAGRPDFGVRVGAQAVKGARTVHPRGVRGLVDRTNRVVPGTSEYAAAKSLMAALLALEDEQLAGLVLRPVAE